MVKKLFERGIVSVRYEVDGQTILVATLIIWPYRVFEVTTEIVNSESNALQM